MIEITRNQGVQGYIEWSNSVTGHTVVHVTGYSFLQQKLLPSIIDDIMMVTFS